MFFLYRVRNVFRTEKNLNAQFALSFVTHEEWSNRAINNFNKFINWMEHLHFGVNNFITRHRTQISLIWRNYCICLANHDSSCVNDTAFRNRTNFSCKGIKLQGLFSRWIVMQLHFFNQFRCVDPCHESIHLCHDITFHNDVTP